MKTCLLLGRKKNVVQDLINNINAENIDFLGGTNLKDVEIAFNEIDIDVVIMGAGLDIDDRLEIVKFIVVRSKSTSIHMKDWASGPRGMLPFVSGVLNGLQN